VLDGVTVGVGVTVLVGVFVGVEVLVGVFVGVGLGQIIELFVKQDTQLDSRLNVSEILYM
jgi:hypothetical protein